MSDRDLRYTIGVDIGGTFTDVVVLDAAGALTQAKSATTTRDLAQGVLDAIAVAAETLGLAPGALLARTELVKHGSTVATNALITRQGVRVGLITTRGFEDTPLIMRAVGRVDGLPPEEVRHVAWVTKPEPLVSPDLIRGVRERIDATGAIIVALDRQEVERVVEDLVETERVDALAVSLLHAWRNPAHEQLIRQVVEARYPDGGPYVAFSGELSQVAGEYARTNTALADAFVGPIVRRYLAELETRLRAAGLAGRLLIMQGNGGLTGREQARPISTLQSGPAGGMLAAAHMSASLGHRRVITTDMGGTSFDVGIVDDGYWRYADEPIFERFRILQPITDIVSIGAGGGTIARVETATRRLLVGPQSAGAVPGPVCYGAGGEEPTVTDADLVLGLLDAEYFLGGRRRLDVQRARDAVEERIARPLGMDVMEAAAGIRRIIDSKMADLIRREVVRSGYRPSEFVLYAFGGAGPVHAVGFAEDLGVGEIHVFPTSAAFSAFGIAMADLVHTMVATRYLPLPAPPAELDAELERLESDLAVAVARIPGAPAPAFRRYASLRFRRQSTGEEVRLPWDRFTPERVDELERIFVRRYEELYGPGTAYVEAGIDLAGLRVDAVVPVPKPPLAAAGHDGDGPAARKGTRRAILRGEPVEAVVYEYDRLRAGERLDGPAIVESPFTTVAVPDGWTADVDEHLGLVLRR